MQIYFHSRLCSYLSRVPILVEDTVYIVYIYIYIYMGVLQLGALLAFVKLNKKKLVQKSRYTVS